MFDMQPDTFDVVIVGSSASGGTLASHLARRGVRVAIAEGVRASTRARTSTRMRCRSTSPPVRFRRCGPARWGSTLPATETPGASAAGVPAYNDLRGDPHETRNLAGDAALARSERELRTRLGAWMKQTGDVFRDKPKLR